MKNLLLLLFLCIAATLSLTAQISEFEQKNTKDKSTGGVERKFQKKEKKRAKPPITDYKIISYTRDTTYVDTTLSMKKEYRFNYLRRDNFELLQFSNTGQTYNSLAKVENPFRLMPRFGARARHFNFMEVEDISYYHMPTPLTEAYFKTTLEQGQQLDAFFTINISPQFNFSFAYKGMRSLGKYKHLLTNSGNFRTTLSYSTKNSRYHNRMHFVAQNLFNEENGGLRSDALEIYLLGLDKGDNESDDRDQLEVNYEDAQNLLKGKRFYLDHQYHIKKKDSASLSTFYVRHQMDLTDKSYLFEQSRPTVFLGPSLIASNLRDDVALEDLTNKFSLNFEHKYLGNFAVGGSLTSYNYGYNSVYIFEDGTRIANRLKGKTRGLLGMYTNTYGGFQIYASGKALISGDFTSQYVQGGIGYEYDSNNSIKIQATMSSAPANYNFLLHQSVYEEYNWQNKQFKNIDQNELKLILSSDKLLDASVQLTTTKNFTYFDSEPEDLGVLAGETSSFRPVITPRQAIEELSLFKITAHRDIKFWKLGLDNTFMYQKVDNGDLIYHVPEIVTRNAFYFNDFLFKNALYLQTGVMVKYFSEYQADGYDPLLAEFYTQNTELLGGFPVVDFFVNAKVRQTRIFFKLENFNELFQQNTQFSASLHPTRDFIIRFGLVWNFFM